MTRQYAKHPKKIAEQLSHPLINYILLFLLCAFIGWVWEVVVTFCKTGLIVNRGVLHGPWLPIYGCGGVIMALTLPHFRKHPWLVFLLAAVSCGILEYFTGWYLETFKHHKWWDYSDMFLNLQGRICLVSVTCFGLAGLLMTYFLKPVFFKLLTHIPYTATLTVALVFVFIFIADSAYASYHPNTGEGISDSVARTIQEKSLQPDFFVIK